MRSSVVLFTDFGPGGPYVGQMKAVLAMQASGVPVIDLMADAPAFSPRPAAYLLAALVPELPTDAVVLAVVDPGVGGARCPMVAEIDGRLFVGPDNGLLEPLLRRSAKARGWRIVWRPGRLSATFHGRDLFAPVAARLALGQTPEGSGCEPIALPDRPDWPDDLAEIVYVDHYGNAMTGLRGAGVDRTASLEVNGRGLPHAGTYSEVPVGAPFWYENSIGLVEISVNQERAEAALNLGIGTSVRVRP